MGLAVCWFWRRRVGFEKQGSREQELRVGV